jgi:hypothetical protein
MCVHKVPPPPVAIGGVIQEYRNGATGFIGLW